MAARRAGNGKGVRLVFDGGDEAMNRDLERLHNLLNESMTLLDQACELVGPSGVEPRKDTVKLLGVAIGYILNARKHLYDLEPRLKMPGK
jgi:hypothetical protein